MTALKDMLGETRADGYEDFIAALEAEVAKAPSGNQLVAKFIRAVSVALIETARAEGDGSPEHSLDILCAAYSACGYALPSMAACTVQNSGLRVVLPTLTAEYFLPTQDALIAYYETLPDEDAATG